MYAFQDFDVNPTSDELNPLVPQGIFFDILGFVKNCYINLSVPILTLIVFGGKSNLIVLGEG